MRVQFAAILSSDNEPWLQLLGGMCRVDRSSRKGSGWGLPRWWGSASGSAMVPARNDEQLFLAFD